MITPDYAGIPLLQALTAIADDVKFPIWLDQKQLEEHGVDPDEPVWLSLPQVPLRQALKYILAPLQLGYRLEADILVVSAKDVIDSQPTLRAYDLSSLAESDLEVSELMESVERNIRCMDPTWSDDVWHIQPMGQRLLVGTSEIVHGEIELLLTDLAQQFGRLPPAKDSSMNTGNQRPATPPSRPKTRSAKPSADPFGGANPFGSGGADPFGR